MQSKTEHRLSAPIKPDNRRRHTRYAVNVLLKYRPAGERGAIWRQGSCVDMSAGGLLIEIEGHAVAGSQLQIVMNWPGLFHGRAMVQLTLIGCVVRLDQRGVAIRIQHHQFRDTAPLQVPLRGQVNERGPNFATARGRRMSATA